MKIYKVTFLFLFYVNCVFSQYITPFYPASPQVSEYNKNQTQITYFELSLISLNFQEFMKNKFNISIVDSKYKIDNKIVTRITNIYSDQNYINKEKKLRFSYDVFLLDDKFIIKNLKITGDINTVLKLYASFWETELNFSEIKRKKIVYNYFLQDKITYNFNNGKPFIAIKNTTINSQEKFCDNFDKKKQLFLNRKKREQERQKKIVRTNFIKDSIIKKRLDEKRNTTYKTYLYKISKRKNKWTYKINEGYPIDDFSNKKDVKKRLYNFIENKKKGTYIVYLKYTLVYQEVIKTEIILQNYTKPSSFFNILKDVIR